MSKLDNIENNDRRQYVMQQEDFIAYLDKEIFIVWTRNADLYVFNDRGDLIDTLRNPDIEDMDDAMYTASDYVEIYYEVREENL